MKRLVFAAGFWVIAVSSGLPQVPGGVSSPVLTDLVLGAPVAQQPTRYREFACGTNGGPPSSPVEGFESFQQCPAEPQTGLHEVQFRYDDEVEYWALANDLMPIAQRYGGTRFGTFPVIVSALFDGAGILRGYRVVTDDRGTARQRRVAYTMGVFAKAQFGENGWDCTETPLADGETPVGRNWAKEDCTTVTPEGWTASLRVRLLHRPGQTAIDPHSGDIRAGLYESTARLEVFDKGYPLTTAEDPMLTAFLTGGSKDCPGCDLAEADLTYRDLSGANLEGADLAKARLHRAILSRANLKDANLEGANLNATDSKFADFSGANLSRALLYEADLSGATLAGAKLVEAKAQHAEFARADLSAAEWTDSDASGAILTGANLRGANLTRIYMPGGDLRQVDFTGANLSDATFFEATFVGAHLEDATIRETDFRKARLNDAVFTGADLSGSAFSEAWIEGADFSGAIVDDVKGLTLRDQE